MTRGPRLPPCAGYDPRSVFASRPLGRPAALPPAFTHRRAARRQRQFFGDARAASDYEARWPAARLGHAIAEVDMSRSTKQRGCSIRGHGWPNATSRRGVHRKRSRRDSSGHAAYHRGWRAAACERCFRAFYRLAELRRSAESACAGSMRSLCRLRRRSIRLSRSKPTRSELNSRLGTYTNFVNLLDLCGTAVPAALHDDSTPFGITFWLPPAAMLGQRPWRMRFMRNRA